MTTMTTTVPTRRAAAIALTAEGVEGAAAELLLDVGAAERHAARVAAAAAAAAACGRLGPLALLLEAVGVGGTRGLDGASTARLPPFRSLGSGRRHARDGEAWSAAIRAASPAASTVEATPDGVRLDDGESIAAVELPPEWAEWVRALAGRALLALARGDIRPDLAWLRFAGEARDWAALFNAADHEMQVARAVARIRSAETPADAAAVATDCCRWIVEALGRLSEEERARWERLMAAG